MAGIKPRDIDFLVVNCSLFCPTPSLSAMIVNHFRMRSNIVSYNLGGELAALPSGRVGAICRHPAIEHHGLSSWCLCLGSTSLGRSIASLRPGMSLRHGEHMLGGNGAAHTRAALGTSDRCKGCGAGMGCSAGMIACGLAQRLLKHEPGKYALVVSTENITQNWYILLTLLSCLNMTVQAHCRRHARPGMCSLVICCSCSWQPLPHAGLMHCWQLVLSTKCPACRYNGNDRSMLIPNTLFRMGAAAMLMTSKFSERRRAKYELEHTVRVHIGADTTAYECALSLASDLHPLACPCKSGLWPQVLLLCMLLLSLPASCMPAWPLSSPLPVALL